MKYVSLIWIICCCDFIYLSSLGNEEFSFYTREAISGGEIKVAACSPEVGAWFFQIARGITDGK